MKLTHKYKNLTWINLESPSVEELDEVGKEFKINPLILKELLFPSDRPKVDVYENFMYLILHFPRYGRKEKTNKESVEIDFVMGKDFLITTHYDPFNPIIEFSKTFEAGSILNKLSMENGGHIYFYLMKKIYENMEEELGEVGEKIQEIEIAIFSENNEDVLENLSRTNKELIDFRRSMRMHRDVFDSFERSAIDFFGNKFSYYTNTLLGDHERIWNVLESNKEILIDLRQTSDSLFSARTNSVIKTLTILTFITIPLSIISNFGQNAKNIPIIGYKSDFWIIIGFMVIIAIIMLVYFRFKKWL